uniref:Uncharacterized protein n=1 Tax=Lepeophtheirus salmonis TaxID=72036 RepID=A0A0K2T419_LEPSM
MHFDCSSEGLIELGGELG